MLTEFSRSITIEQLERDPYAIYKRLRTESPVANVPCANIWFATTWEAAEAVATNQEKFVAAFEGSPLERSFGAPFILTADGAVHRELRGTIDPYYRPNKLIQFFDELCRPIAEETLDALPQSAPVDIMSDYFEMVSAICVGRTLGFRDTDGPTLTRWFHDLAQGGINYENDPQRQRICDAACAEVDAVLVPTLERLRQDPDNSLLSNMLFAGMAHGDARPIELILPSIKVTMLGGMQEPGHGAGNTLVGLLQQPEQFQRVAAERGTLLRRALNEGLRWVGPIGTQVRTAVEDIEVAGTLVPRGTAIGAVLTSANRDEARFGDPDQFDIFRQERANAAFGFGPHICAGRSFAPMLMELMLDLLLERFPRIEYAAGFTPEFRGWEFRTAPSIVVTLHRS